MARADFNARLHRILTHLASTNSTYVIQFVSQGFVSEETAKALTRLTGEPHTSESSSPAFIDGIVSRTNFLIKIYEGETPDEDRLIQTSGRGPGGPYQLTSDSAIKEIEAQSQTKTTAYESDPAGRNLVQEHDLGIPLLVRESITVLTNGFRFDRGDNGNKVTAHFIETGPRSASICLSSSSSTVPYAVVSYKYPSDNAEELPSGWEVFQVRNGGTNKVQQVRLVCYRELSEPVDPSGFSMEKQSDPEQHIHVFEQVNGLLRHKSSPESFKDAFPKIGNPNTDRTWIFAALAAAALICLAGILGFFLARRR
jgi:hypothetical protein